jgi:hypothetical protein
MFDSCTDDMASDEEPINPEDISRSLFDDDDDEDFSGCSYPDGDTDR